MSSIVILTGSHLCHNPRVLKEASSLAEANHRVEVLGAWFDSDLKARDEELLQSANFKFRPVVDFTGGGLGTRLNRLTARALTKLGRLTHRYASLENKWQLGYVVAALTRTARLASGHLYIAHSEQAMLTAYHLLRAGRRVGVDMEDWFSEDLPPESRKARPLRLLRKLEATLLREGAYSSCTSVAMSKALEKEYGCRQPVVLYNTFAWAERESIDGRLKDRKDRQAVSIHWYSQTLGPGRGLEDLMAALPHVNQDAEIHLRGTVANGFKEWLDANIPVRWRGKVFFHGLVSNAELLSRIAEHDIGFAGEMKYSLSRDLTVTNKILHYLLAGLAVVASDTAGQAEVATKAPDSVLLYPSGNPLKLAERLNVLLASRSALASAKRAALRAAEQTFCWEKTGQTLIRSAEAALAR